MYAIFRISWHGIYWLSMEQTYLDMKKLTLFLTSLVMCTLFTMQANAQTAIGLRATPDGGGFTVKSFITHHLAFEGQLNAGGILALEGQSFNAVGLLEYHIILPDPSWRIFFGGGLHTGVWDRGYRYVNDENRYMDDKRGIFGIDAIGGVEYKFKRIPLGLSADIKPAVNFLAEPGFFDHNMFGFAARFYF